MWKPLQRHLTSEVIKRSPVTEDRVPNLLPPAHLPIERDERHCLDLEARSDPSVALGSSLPFYRSALAQCERLPLAIL